MNRRWVAIAVVLVGFGLAALVLFETAPEPARVAVPELWTADAGRLVLSAPVERLTGRGSVFPTAVVTPVAAKACIRGRVVDGVTARGIASATVTFATFAGVMAATSTNEGRFELANLSEGVVSLGELAAPGYATQHGLLELRLVEGRCVSDLMLTLQPSVFVVARVVDLTGSPIANANVSYGTDQSAPMTRTTNAAGEVTLETPDGTLVEASADGFESASAVVDFRAITTRSLVLRLSTRDGGIETTTLTGIVVDENDAGVDEAQVEVRRTFSTRDGAFERLEAVQTTPTSGAFSFSPSGSGPWLVSAQKGSKRASVSTTTSPVRLVLTAGATLTGTVHNALGGPVVSFSVLVAHHVDELARTELPVRHVVDPLGRFRLTGLPPGAVDVRVASAGFAPSSTVVAELSVFHEASVDVTLNVGASVTGTVIDRESRASLAGARVSLERATDDAVMPLAVSRTDERGRFTLAGVPAGRRSLLITAAQHDARLVSVDVTTQPQNLEVDLAPVPDGGSPELELVGIGAALKAQGIGLVVERVMPGGGAAEVGLLTGDLIVRIDGTTPASMGFEGSIERIRGPEGTTVMLELQRPAGIERISTPRRRIKH